MFSPVTSNSGLLRVSDSGGDPVEVTKVDPETEVGHVWPQFLPDGRHFIYLSLGKAAERSAIYLGSLDGEAPRRLIQSTVRAAYATGYLLFMRESALMAQPFDAKRLTLSGEPVRVADQIATNIGGGRAAFAVSESGMLAYRFGGSGGVLQQLVWIDRQGKSTILVADAAQYRTHDLSADGKRLVMHRHEASSNKGDLWILELDRNLTTRFTFDGNHNFAPIWSPDGNRVVYASAKKRNTDDLYQKIANGASGEDLLLESPDSKHPDDWSKDGRYILYESSAGPANSDLYVLPTFGDKQPIPFANTSFRERKGRFSPDGKWIAYTSNESGTDQVYIQPFPPNGGKWQISASGGFEPRWRSDGKELYYINSRVDPKIIGVSITWTTIPEPGPPQELVSLTSSNYGVDDANQYVASPDGQKFLAIRDINDVGSGSITVLINWLANLRQ